MARGFQHPHHLLMRHPLEGIKELTDTYAVLQILEKRIHRHARAAKTHPPTKALRVAPKELSR